jgi:hypothetical protein
MATMTERDRSIDGRRRCDEAAYRRLFVATYPVFLVIAAGQWLAARTGLVREAGAPRSILSRARHTAHAVIPFAFMG